MIYVNIPVVALVLLIIGSAFGLGLGFIALVFIVDLITMLIDDVRKYKSFMGGKEDDTTRRG